MVKWFDLIIQMVLGKNCYDEMFNDYPKLQSWNSNPWNSKALAVEVGGRHAGVITFMDKAKELYILHINERYAWKDTL